MPERPALDGGGYYPSNASVVRLQNPKATAGVEPGTD
jgi:hypothetical protein